MSFDMLRMSGIFKIPARGEPVEPFEREVRKKNMICGIGTDIVDISRFAPWVEYPQERLLKIFSPQELVACSGEPQIHRHPRACGDPGKTNIFHLKTILGFKMQALPGYRVKPGMTKEKEQFLHNSQPVRGEEPEGRLESIRTAPRTELIPEKLATRFAAKEAFFKALSATLERKGLTQKEFSLSFICRTVSVTQTPWGTPQLAIDWQSIHEKIGHPLPSLSTHLSLSHDGSMAIAFVVIEE